jgi:hypothetical protein
MGERRQQQSSDPSEDVPKTFWWVYMQVMATIQDLCQLELPIAQKMICRRCCGAGEVYYARTGADVVGGKRIECPECDGRGEIDLAVQLFRFDPVSRPKKRR